MEHWRENGRIHCDVYRPGPCIAENQNLGVTWVFVCDN